jgi:glycerate dehydrogenase
MPASNIVVLDGYTLNPGDLSWAGLAALGSCRIYDRTPAEAVVERARGAQVVLTNKTVLHRAAIEALPELGYIGVLATGFNVVDLAAASERGIPVTNVPNYGTPAVAQHTFALILELTHHVGEHAGAVRHGRWCRSPDFCFWDHPLVELQGLTLGIIGLGNIGQAVAAIGRAFGMRVLAYSVPAAAPGPLAEPVDLETVVRQADVLSLHCPLTPETRGLIDARTLERMKPGAILINTSRGPLVVEQDLANALNSGRLGGAGLDVLAVEPPSPENPLLTARNCVVTPHVGWATRAARARLLRRAVANVEAFLAGRPIHVVNR